MININLEQAKNIWKDIIRINRLSIFDKLDIEFFKALESSDIKKIQSIGRRKDILRNATSDSRFNKVKDINQLKTIFSLDELNNV
jgi:hypothetical protein